jgi:glycosyltransferase involved in cell wall biosynthesis
VYQKADSVLSISSAVKRTIVNLGEVPLDKVRVIYNPVCSFQLPVLSACLSDRQEVEASVGSKQRPENGAFAFVTTCRLVPIKNLTRLIQALEGLVEENPNRPLLLRVVGDGPELKNLEFIIQNLELGTKVELVGFQTDVGPYLWEADAFILPSLQEGSSVSLAEAMTAGLPSIVTKVGGAPEILGKSQSGILIDPLSTSEIQNAMQSFLDLSVDERKEMGQRAQEEAKRFSVENYIESLMSVYGLSDFILPAAAGLQPSDL